jgi:hypothetical protein
MFKRKIIYFPRCRIIDFTIRYSINCSLSLKAGHDPGAFQAGQNLFQKACGFGFKK